MPAAMALASKTGGSSAKKIEAVTLRELKGPAINENEA
jgi:hypothetical protein